MNLDIFSYQILLKSLFVLVYSNQDDDSKRFKAKKFYLNNATDAGDNDQSKFVSAILQKIKERRLRFSQGSVIQYYKRW